MALLSAQSGGDCSLVYGLLHISGGVGAVAAAVAAVVTTTIPGGLTVPHRLLEAGLEVGHALDVLAARLLVGSHHRVDLLQQLLLGAGVT